MINKSNGKILSLQGLRAIAFLGVFISHASNKYEALGPWGVSIFFILSGFLMIYSYWYKDEIPKVSLQFAWKKIKKLYPLHIATMLCFAFGNIYDIIREGAYTKFVKLLIDIGLNTTLTQIWIPWSKFYTPLNSVSWYLCACVFLYFCFPILLRIVKKYKKISHGILAIGILFAIQLFISFIAFCFGNVDVEQPFSMRWITYLCPISGLIDFSIGCCLGYIFINRKGQSKFSITYCIAEIIVALLILVSWFFYIKGVAFFGSEYFKYTALFTPTTVVLIWLIASNLGFASRILSLKLFTKIGDLSPYTFLIHTVVLKCCGGMLIKLSISNIYLIAIVSFIVTLIAAKCWILIMKRIKFY